MSNILKKEHASYRRSSIMKHLKEFVKSVPGLPQDRQGKLQIQAGRYSSPCNTRTAGQVYNKSGYNQIWQA